MLHPEMPPPAWPRLSKSTKKQPPFASTPGNPLPSRNGVISLSPPYNTPPLPPGDITHYHLFPPFSSPQTRNPDIPVPLQADLMDSTCEGHWFHLPNLRHVLNHEDLMGWGCIQAANLVAELPFDDTAWIYTDGSSGERGHGSAFAIFWHVLRPLPLVTLTHFRGLRAMGHGNCVSPPPQHPPPYSGGDLAG